MISAPPLSLSQIGYAIVLLCLVCFAGSLYLGIWVWNGHVAQVEAELCFFLWSCRITGFRYVPATGNDHDCRKAIALRFCI